MEVNHVDLLLSHSYGSSSTARESQAERSPERRLHGLGKRRRAAQLFAEPLRGLSLGGGGGESPNGPFKSHACVPSGCTRQCIRSQAGLGGLPDCRAIAFLPCHVSKTLSKIASKSGKAMTEHGAQATGKPGRYCLCWHRCSCRTSEHA